MVRRVNQIDGVDHQTHAEGPVVIKVIVLVAHMDAPNVQLDAIEEGKDPADTGRYPKLFLVSSLFLLFLLLSSLFSRSFLFFPSLLGGLPLELSLGAIFGFLGFLFAVSSILLCLALLKHAENVVDGV